MYRMILKLCVVFFIVSEVSAQSVRKYNVEDEALKLYKQDFKSVLKRFRRTPDYLKILQDKMAELKTATKEMSLQVFHYYRGKMENHVLDVLPAQSGTIKLDDEKDQNYFRTGDRAEPPPPHIPEADWKKINDLDKYNFFYSHLTVPERNSLKEMGFSYAGKVINAIVSNLKPVTKPEEDKEKITKTTKPDEAETATTTATAHPENPKVSSPWVFGKYVFDDGSSQHEVKPLDITGKTAPLEDRRFRASTARSNLTALRKQAGALSQSTPATLSTRKVVTSIVSFK